MSTPIPEYELAPIKDELFHGRKIDAIKLYRRSTGVGLAEAKSAVEKLEQELRETSPDKFIATPQGQGCLGLVIAGCVLTSLAIWWKVVK